MVCLPVFRAPALDIPSGGSTPRRELHTKLMLQLLSKAHMSEPAPPVEVEKERGSSKRRKKGIFTFRLSTHTTGRR
jgi:hypothetical protein